MRLPKPQVFGVEIDLRGRASTALPPSLSRTVLLQGSLLLANQFGGAHTMLALPERGLITTMPEHTILVGYLATSQQDPPPFVLFLSLVSMVDC